LFDLSATYTRALVLDFRETVQSSRLLAVYAFPAHETALKVAADAAHDIANTKRIAAILPILRSEK